jgi:hypothetical protein
MSATISSLRCLTGPGEIHIAVVAPHVDKIVDLKGDGIDIRVVVMCVEPSLLAFGDYAHR